MKAIVSLASVILCLSLYKVVDAATCKYYPSYPYSYTYYTTYCSYCCGGYATSSSAACCYSSYSSSSFEWYYVVAPILGVIVFCVILPILLCVCIANSNKRSRVQIGQGSIISTGNVNPYPGPPKFNVPNNGQIINTNSLPNNYNTNYGMPMQPFNSNNNFNNPPNPSAAPNNPFFEQAKFNDFTLQNSANQPTTNTQETIMPTIPNALSTNPGSIF